MARADQPVLASLPAACAVCGGARVVYLVQLSGMRDGGPVACPHCSDAEQPIPIYIYPARTDRPRRGVA